MFALRKDLKSIFRNDSIFKKSSQGLVLQGNVHAPFKVAMVSSPPIFHNGHPHEDNKVNLPHYYV